MPSQPIADRFLTIAEACQMLRYSESQLRRLEELGLMPLRRQIGPRKTGFLESEVRAWMRARPGVRAGASAR